MKKKIVGLFFMLLCFCIFCIAVIKNNNSKYIMENGILFAMTLDGEEITEWPEGTNYRVNIKCKNAIGTWLPEEWKLSLEDITGNVSCKVDFVTRSSDDLINNVVKNSIPDNNIDNTGYRYVGKEPNNWVWFNNEMWRIIGSIPTKQLDGTTINLVKIMRNEIIGGHPYHSSNSSSYALWSKNTLYTLLNSYYYGKKDITGTAPCRGGMFSGTPLCNYTVMGISSNASDYYGRMVKKVYWNVGFVNTSNSDRYQIYTNEASNQTVSGYVGLMHLSDYEYSAGEGRMYASCANSWICGSGDEWTMTSEGDISPAFIHENGTSSSSAMRNNASVRPAVFLNESVYVVSGDGSATIPYTLFMK